MSVIIRPVASTDRRQWRELWTAYLDFYETTVTDAVYKITFDRICDPDNDVQHGLVAEQEGELVGLAHFIYHPHNWRLEDVCYLQDLYAEPSVRGTGVGRKLMEAVYAAADTRGSPSVYWLTQDFNETARKLYDRIGQVTPFIKYNRP